MLGIRPTDADLVRKTLEGRPEAFEALVLRNLRKAHAVARAAGLSADEAEDAVQEAFLRAFRGLGTLEDPSSFAPWLLAIVRNAARTIREKRPSAASGAVPEQAAPVIDLDAADFREYLWDRVAVLPEDVREAIFLYYHEGRSIREVARAMGVTSSGAKKRLRRGKEILRERLWRELADCLCDMLPSAREWRRKARSLGLLVVAAIPAMWATRIRAAPLEPVRMPEPARAPTQAGAIGMVIAGGIMVSGKKVSILVAVVVLLLAAISTGLLLWRPVDEAKEIAGDASPGPAVRDRAEKAPIEEATPHPEEPGQAPQGPGRIFAIVTDPEGEPIEGAEVACGPEKPGGPPGSAAAETDASGTTELSGLSLGRHMLMVRAEGFGREQLAVDLTEGSEDVEVEIALTLACALRGKVRNLAGEAVEGCRFSVSLKQRSGRASEWLGPFEETVVSDAKGEFHLDALPNGLYAMKVVKEGWDTRIERIGVDLYLSANEISFASGRSLEVQVLAYRGRTVEGALTFKGRPVKRATIRFLRKEEKSEMASIFFPFPRAEAEPFTHDDGMYRVAECVPGTYEVQVKVGWSWERPLIALETFEVPEPREGERTLRKDFQIGQEDAGVGGSLTDAGRLTPGQVHLFRRTDPETVERLGTVAADDGLFWFPGLDDGPYFLCGFADGHPAGSIHGTTTFKVRALPGEVEVLVQNGSGPQDVIVPAVGGDCSVSGRVVTATGLPVSANVSISVDSGGFTTEGSVNSEKDGAFFLNGLPPSTVRLHAQARGFAPADVTVSIPKPGETVHVDLVMAGMRTLRIRLEYLDPNPESFTQIDLKMKRADGGWEFVDQISPGMDMQTGTMEKDSLAPGIYRATAQFLDHADAMTPEIDLLERESAEVVLGAEAGAALSGKIIFEDADLAKAARSVVLYYEDGLICTKKIAIDGGTYRIEHLRKGVRFDLHIQGTLVVDGQEREYLCSAHLRDIVANEDASTVDLGPVPIENRNPVRR